MPLGIPFVELPGSIFPLTFPQDFLFLTPMANIGYFAIAFAGIANHKFTRRCVLNFMPTNVVHVLVKKDQAVRFRELEPSAQFLIEAGEPQEVDPEEPIDRISNLVPGRTPSRLARSMVSRRGNLRTLASRMRRPSEK
jgi:hypothetical protein